MKETKIRKFPEAGEFHSTNTASSGVVFEIRAALGLSRAAFAKAIKGNVRTIEGAERRGGSITGAPALRLYTLAQKLPASEITPTIQQWIDDRKREIEAHTAALGETN